MRWLLLATVHLPLLAQQWTFPHQPHLAMGMDCQSCHPTAATSRHSGDQLLPDGQLCGTCHDGDAVPAVDLNVLTQKEPEERSYRFDHAFHLDLGNVAPLIAAAIDGGDYFGKPGDARRFLDGTNPCTACHRGLEESMVVASTVHLPRMGDCIVCHTKVDNPFSCPECHLEGVELMPADHTREFVDQHSSGKIGLDKQSCLPCHGRNFGCMGCH